MIVISDGDGLKKQVDKDFQPVSWVMINDQVTL
jgi:hypothetical protein